VNGYSRPVSKRVALSLFIFFLSLSFVIGEEKEKKKDFSSFAYMLVGDYMCMCVCENKQKAECWRVLSTMRYIKKESVRRFEIGRDKKSTTTTVSHTEQRERGSSSIHSDVLLEISFSYSVRFFFFYY
jgi:hypothetical protein